MNDLTTLSNYPRKTSDHLVLSFGRFNPPTAGHERLLNALKATAGEKSDYNVFVSHSQDKKKNPLSSYKKVQIMRAMFPAHAANIIYDQSVRTIVQTLQSASRRGYKKVTLVAGSDRLEEFELLVHKYNKIEFTFDFVQVVSAGSRSSSSSDAVAAISSSIARAAAVKGDFERFSQLTPRASAGELTKMLYNEVRSGLCKS